MKLDYVKLGKNVRQARNNLKLTQEQLAEKIDVSTVFISQIETGVRKASLETIYKLSLSLKVPVDDLLKKEPASDITEYNELSSLLEYCTPKEIGLITELVRVVINNLQEDKLI